MEKGLAQMYGDGAGNSTKHYYERISKKPKKKRSCTGKCDKCKKCKKKK